MVLLSISSDPVGAAIYIDNISTGQVTPTTTPLDISPGQHTYTLTASGYMNASGSIDIVSGTDYYLSVVMTSTQEAMIQTNYDRMYKLYVAGLVLAAVALIPALFRSGNKQNRQDKIDR